MSTMDAIHTRTRIVDLGITQERLALQLSIDPATLSRYLRGLRPMPEGFAERIASTLDRLEAEERAADEARARVRAELAEEREVVA